MWRGHGLGVLLSVIGLPVLGIIGGMIGVAVVRYRSDPPDPSTREGLPFVEEFRREAGPALTECLDEVCVRRHEADCTAAHLHDVVKTEDGDPLHIDFFVRRRGQSAPTKTQAPAECEVIGIWDYSLGPKTGCWLTKVACPTYEAQRAQNKDGLGCTVGTLGERTCEPE